MCPSSRLPPPLQDLRIDVPSIKLHPWFNKPLPEKYMAALEELRGCQVIVEEQVKQGAFSSPERDKQLEVRQGGPREGSERWEQGSQDDCCVGVTCSMVDGHDAVNFP